MKKSRFLGILAGRLAVLLLVAATLASQPQRQGEQLASVNEHLANQMHPYSGVIYRWVATQREPSGESYWIVVPEFTAVFEATLPNGLLLASDAKQKKYLNKLLKDAVKDTPALRQQFSQQQLQHIYSERVPLGYVWHHDAPLGKMQLVDKVLHDATPHTGGRWIWGGGQSNRK